MRRAIRPMPMSSPVQQHCHASIITHGLRWSFMVTLNLQTFILKLTLLNISQDSVVFFRSIYFIFPIQIRTFLWTVKMFVKVTHWLQGLWCWVCWETAKTELDECRKDVDNVKNEKYTRSGWNVYCLTSINPPLQTMQQLKITSQTRRKGKLWIKNQTEESDRWRKPSGLRRRKHQLTEMRTITSCPTCTMTSSVISTDEVNM